MADRIHRIMSMYYKDDRDRAEKCLGAILDIVVDETESQPAEKVRQLLIKHYSRDQLPVRVSVV